MAKRLLTGAQILCESLIANDVDVMFGIPGGAVLPFYDALPSYPQIHHVLMRHEQAGGFAADGYARVQKKAGVSLGTSGPGATNLLTAIVNAQMDSVPVVFLTGQVASSVMGSDAFQETDILGMTYAAVKHSYSIFSPDDIAHAMHEAFAIAQHGRPGPVLVDVTKDAMQAKAWYDPRQKYKLTENHFQKTPKQSVDAMITRLANLLDDPETKPVVVVGHGVTLDDASVAVKTFIERHNIPMVNTLLGTGTIPLSHPCSLSMLGMHGEAVANYVVHAANLVIGIGIRFDDRITGKLDVFKQGKHFVHFEIDPSEVHKNVSALLPFYGSIKANLALVNKRIKNKHQFKEWWAHITAMKHKYPMRSHEDIPTKWKANKALSAPYVISRISEITDGKAIVSSDVGRHQMWIPRFYDFQNSDSLLSSGGLGAMGYGMPAALGAAFAAPDREVWAICGDGSFQMNIQELATLKQEGLRLRIAIMNDSVLGIVRQWQQLLYKNNISQTMLEPINFAEIAKAYGHGSRVVKRTQEIDEAIAEARAYPGTFLLDFRTDPDEHVYPMVPPFTPLGEQIIG
ncbi:biosynthetic-type acetolactate synthase large subunit [Candidatus Gracilibacteria bacterium]|nr:biosynthetic-type acetolactate synthase large subunit [Candidatus Gracilibacteria bacterium]